MFKFNMERVVTDIAAAMCHEDFSNMYVIESTRRIKGPEGIRQIEVTFDSGVKCIVTVEPKE